MKFALVIISFSIAPILCLTLISAKPVEDPSLTFQSTLDHYCAYNNATYKPGEKFHPDPCTTCHCPKQSRSRIHSEEFSNSRSVGRAGRPHCIIRDCMPLSNCLKVDHTKDQCCGTCVEWGCRHTDGKVYMKGTVLNVTDCRVCECPLDEASVHTVCSIKEDCMTKDQHDLSESNK